MSLRAFCLLLALGVVAALCAFTAPCDGGVVTQTANDPGGQTSWNTGTRWSDGLPPSAGNDYVTPEDIMFRTPETGGVAPFAGDSLTIRGTMALKHAGSATVADLRLDGGGILHGNPGTTITLAGNIDLTQSATIDTYNTDRTIVLDATISGSSGLNLHPRSIVPAGAGTPGGTLVFGGTSANTYGGTTTVQNAGMLQLDKPAGVTAIPGDLTIVGTGSPYSRVYTMANNQFGANSVIEFQGSNFGIFELLSTTQTVAGLTGNSSGIIQNRQFGPGEPGGTGHLILTGTGTSEFAGRLRDRYPAGDDLGVLALTKNGGGTQILSGNSNSYTGATTIHEGTLELRNTGSAFNSPITVHDEGILSLAATNVGFTNRSDLAGPLVSGTGVINVGNAGAGIAGGWVTVSRGFSGGGARIWDFDGTINVNSGVLTRDNTNPDTIRGTATVNIGPDGVLGTRGGSVTVGALNGSGAVSPLWSGTNATTLRLGNGGQSGHFSGTIHGAGGGSDGTLEGGTLSLLKVGAGTQILSGANTYRGGTTISAGTLRVTNTAGLGSGQVVMNGGTLELLHNGPGSGETITYNTNDKVTNTGNTFTIHVGNNGANTDNTIAWPGTYNLGNSTLNVTGANGYRLELPEFRAGGGGAGTAIVNPTSANLILGNVSNWNTGHTLRLGGTSAGNRITGTMSNGAGTLAIDKTGTGTWTFTGNNTYTGTTTLRQGTLAVASTSNVGTGLLDFRGNLGIITFRSADASTLTIDNPLNLATDVILGSAGNGDLVFNGTMDTGGGAKTLTINNATTTFNGVISGTNQALAKDGPGTLVFAAANTYSKPTIVNAGTLLVNGTHTGGGLYTVHAGATLGGTGTIGSSVSLLEGGILSPGTSVGTLGVLGDLNFDAGAFFDIDIMGTGDGNADLLTMDGGLLTPGDATIGVHLGFSPDPGESWLILDGAGGIDGLFDPEVAVLSGEELLGGWKWFEVGYGVTDGSHWVVLNAVPEPGAWLLLLSAVACGLLVRRR